jgi:hypothetical protein
LASTKTWLWIVFGVVASFVLGLCAMAGAGVYFVAQHIDTHHASTTDALHQFEVAREAQKDQRPLFELDELGRPRLRVPIQSLPTSSVRPTDMVVLAWNPTEERTVRVRLPFWLLRLGHHRVDVLNADPAFDMQRLNLDVNELERIGPAFLLDFRAPTGERVLIWTQ